MDRATLIDELKAEMSRCLAFVPHDRWILGKLESGRLWIVADSSRPNRRAFARCTRVSPLARRCLYERLPLVVTSLCPPALEEPLREWEVDWPALVYVPVLRRRRRGEGLLVVGSRSPRRYGQPDVDFLADLGAVVAPWLAELGPAKPPTGGAEHCREAAA